MTITYPRNLPSDQFKIFNLNLAQTDSLSRSVKGRAISVIEFEDPFWTLEVETIELDRARRQMWDAWEETLRGGKKFITHHIGREWPIAYYPAGIPEILNGTWDGKGSLTLLNPANPFRIVATGIPVGFNLKEGDMIGLEQNGKYFLMKVSEDAKANGVGGILVLITSRIPTNVFSVGATVVFYKPKVSMVIVPSSFECQETTRPEPVTFKAVQKL